MASPVVVVTGLQFEARLAAGPGIRVVCQQNTALAEHLEVALTPDCVGVVSFGTAGGLVDELRPGDWVVATAVIDGAYPIACDAKWSDTLLRALPRAQHAYMAGVTAPVSTVQAKRALHAATGAATVDMESHIVARIARARGIPFVCCRVVIDPVERALPPAALAGMRQDGSIDMKSVLRSIVTQPSQLPALLEVARNAHDARRTLKHGRQYLADAFLRFR